MIESQEAATARRWRWTILWVAAAALLLFGLGAKALWGSEGRWAEVVREMFITGDFLHPRINWEPYFDKPLLSYWFIAFFSWFNGGVVNEMLSRLPSALAALAALWATASLGKSLFNERAAYYSCWILLTTYSFAFWGRTAAADMENVAFIIAPLAWYFARKERPGFLSYFVFWALCAVGGQTKGLGAIVLPAALVAIDMWLDKSFKKHFNIQSILAAAAGALIYFLPFIIEGATRGDYSSSGLSLVFRENIQRFFQPFDHDEPWFVYFIYTPQLFLPWTPLLILAGIWAGRSWKALDRNAKWLCLAALATFAIFTASGSRRVYYILPLMPLCALLCGLWLDDSSKRIMKLDKLRDLLFKTLDWLLLIGAIVAALAPWPLLLLKLKPFGVFIPPQALISFSITGALAVLFRTLTTWRLEPQERCKCLTPYFLRLSIVIWIALFGAYSLVIPSFEMLRTGKAFALRLGELAKDVPPENVFFFRKAPTDTVFYMGLKGRAPVLRDATELAAILDKPSSGRRLLIIEMRYFEELAPGLRIKIGALPLASESILPWSKESKRRLLLLELSPGNTAAR